MTEEYKRHYDKFIDCDFCGQATKGRIYPDRPTAVHCGACNRVIVNRPAKEERK